MYPNAEGQGEDAEEDLFAKKKQQVTMASLRKRRHFFSEAAAEWALRHFGDLEPVADGFVFKVSDRQAQVLGATTAVSAVQSLRGRVQVAMGAALVKSLKPMTSAQVCLRCTCCAHVSNRQCMSVF